MLSILDSNERSEYLDVPFGTFKPIRRTGSCQICQNVPGGSVLQNEAHKCPIFGTKRPRHLILDSNEMSKCLDVYFSTFRPN